MTPESQIKRYTVPEFAARIRAKYPDQYKDLSDDDLTMRVLKEHPEYGSRVNLGTEQDALAAVEQTRQRADQAKQKLMAAQQSGMSATGRTLNPVVTPGTDYFRPLTTTEQAAQKRGEPVIISEAGQEAPVSPTLATRPRLSASSPVSLAPVIQSRLEAIQREQRQRELQAKVEKARQRLPRGLVLPAGQKNQGAAYQPKFGMGQTYREVPQIDTSIPNTAEFIQKSALGTPKPQPTFEQDRAAREAATRPLQGVGDLRRYEEQQAKEEARIKSGIRAQVLKEESEREAAAASGSEAQLMAQRARQEGLNPPDIEGQVDQRYQSYLRAIAPEMVEQRKVFGELSPAARAIAAPVARSIGGLMKTASGLTSLGGLTPNDFSRWANARGAFVEESASLAPLNEKGEEIVRGLPEKAVSAATDLGLSISQLVVMKRATGLSLSTLMALETTLKTSDKPVKDRAKEVAQSYAMGSVLDQHLGRLASAALFGAPSGLENIAAYKQGNMTLEDALLQTGIQAGAGFILGGKGATKLPKEAVDYTLKSPLTPEPVKDVVANAVKYGKGLIRSEDGRAMSLYADPKTGEVFGSEITAKQAAKYDPTIITGEKRPVRNAKEISAEDYDMLARTLGVETKTKPKALPGAAPAEPVAEKNVTPKPEQVSVPDQKPEVRAEKPSSPATIIENPQQIALDQSAEVRTGKTQNIIPAKEPAVTPPAEVKAQPSATESQLTTAKEVTDEVGAEERRGVPAPIAEKPGRIEVAKTGNRGTFDPDNPNILMARSEDPWANIADLAKEFERIANEPESGEKPPKPLPELKDNYRKPLSEYADVLYREVGPDGALDMLPTSRRMTDIADVYLSNTPELALGQGRNKGILLEFEPQGIEGQVNRSKPAWEPLYQQGQAEFIARYNRQKQYQDALTVVRVSPDVKMSRVEKMQIDRALKEMEEAGWIKTKAPDGSDVYRKPLGSPTSTKREEPTIKPEDKPTEVKQSKLAAGVEAKAIEAKLTAGFQGLPEYETVKVADQARMASDLLRNDPQRAKAVALGQTLPPENLLPESVFIAVENDALQKGDVDTLRELATASTLSTEATGMGQRIRMLGERNPYSPVTAMKEIQTARETRAKKKMGPKFKEKVVNEIKTEVRKKAPKAKDWKSFLAEIQCKALPHK